MKNLIKKHSPILSIFFVVLITTSCNPSSEERAEIGTFISFFAAFVMMSLLTAPLVISKERPNPRYSTKGPKIIAIVLLILSGIGLAIWFPFMLKIVGDAMAYGYQGMAMISLLCYLAPAIMFIVAIINLAKKKEVVDYADDDYTPTSKSKPDDSEELYDNVADL